MRPTILASVLCFAFIFSAFSEEKATMMKDHLVMKDGTVMAKDGAKMMLKDGEMVGMDGVKVMIQAKP